MEALLQILRPAPGGERYNITTKFYLFILSNCIAIRSNTAFSLIKLKLEAAKRMGSL